MFAAGQPEQALAQMNSADYGEFAALYYELRGDIHASQGELEAARQDYQSALAGDANSNAMPLVRMKLESLPRDTATDRVLSDDES
jgi:predicted negative regulator of RcsB-dependent stress response